MEAALKARRVLVLLSAAIGFASFGGCTVHFGDPADVDSVPGPSGQFPGPPPTQDGPASTSQPPSSVSAMLGAACKTNMDCGGVLYCLSAGSDDPIFGGGPAGGFCTKACDTNDDCPGSVSACLKNSAFEAGRCTLTCTIGPP